MPMNAAERMSRLRLRQREAGLVSATLVIPGADATAFARLAARRREAQLAGRLAPDVALGSPDAWTRRRRADGISRAELLEVRELLEVVAVTLVARHMNTHAARRLASQVAREASLDGSADSADLQRFHLLLGELSGDHALELLLRLALQITDDRSPFAKTVGRDREEVISRVIHLHRGIADALIERNEVLAIRRMRRYLAGLKTWIR